MELYYVYEVSVWNGWTQHTYLYNIKTFLISCSRTFYHFTACIEAFGLYVVYQTRNRNFGTWERNHQDVQEKSVNIFFSSTVFE